MKRRDVLAALALGTAGLPSRLFAQQVSELSRKVGILSPFPRNDQDEHLAAFRSALEERGWRVGENLQLQLRYGDGDVEKMRSGAVELAKWNPDVVFTITTPATSAVQRETATIPIVFTIVSDPVGSGFVQTFAVPGGNLTGFVNIEASLAGKWIELLKEIAPGVVRVGLLFNPETAPYFRYYLQPFEIATLSSNIKVVTLPVQSEADIERAISNLRCSSQDPAPDSEDILSASV